MHDDEPSQPAPEYRSETPQYRTAIPNPNGKKRGRLGAALVGLGLIAAKFKTLLLVLGSLKWLALATKFGLSFGSIFVSMWLYATVFGWKLGIVFVLLILVHEMGHWVVLRGMGVAVSLPYFIPGLGAFVAQKSATGSSVQDAIAAVAGPAVGIGASAICQAYGLATGNPFWIAAANIGFFLNLFNLIPVLPFDGGRIAGAIDPRLWLVGLGIFAVYAATSGMLHSGMALLIVAIVAVFSIPRAIPAWRGVVDPRVAATPLALRAFILLGYAVVIAMAALGYAATQHAAGMPTAA